MINFSVYKKIQLSSTISSSQGNLKIWSKKGKFKIAGVERSGKELRCMPMLELRKESVE